MTEYDDEDFVKEDVLEKINIIKSSLIDNQKFMPFNYNIFILWAIVSAFLFLTFEYILKTNLVTAIIYIVLVIVFTFSLEYYLIKKENLKYNIHKYTKTQRFMENLYIYIVIFSSISTYLLISNDLITYAYILWIFMISLAHYILGFILNNKYFSIIGVINIIAVFILLIIINIYGLSIFSQSIKYISVVFLSFGLMYIGLNSRKEFEFV